MSYPHFEVSPPELIPVDMGDPAKVGFVFRQDILALHLEGWLPMVTWPVHDPAGRPKPWVRMSVHVEDRLSPALERAELSLAEVVRRTSDSVRRGGVDVRRAADRRLR